MPGARVAETPAGRRIQLGALLRQLRQRSGLTQHEVGSKVWPDMKQPTAQNKLTRLEAGDGGIRPDDLEHLLAVYGVIDAGHIGIMHQLNTGTSQRGRHRVTMGENERKLADLIADAAIIREAAFETVPALLQCESYMRAQRASRAEVLEAEITAQRAQQELVLYTNAAQVYAILSESCVRRVFGSTAVLREQIEHLITLSRQSNISIHLIPFEPAASGTALFECFTLLTLACPPILDSVIKYVDLPYGRLAGEPVYAPARNDAFHRLWVRVANAALDPAQTRRYLSDIATELA